MSSAVIWMLGLGTSVAALVLTAAMKLQYVHMAVAALVSILVALAAFQEGRGIVGGRQQAGMLASSGFRHLGLIWTWAALALLVTYSFILQWREWWQYFIGFIVLAGLCLFMSATLRKDAEADDADATMFSVGRVLAMVLLITGLAVMVGLAVHDGRQFTLGGKLLKFATLPKSGGSEEWAANSIFFFGALAVSAVSWNTLSILNKIKH